MSKYCICQAVPTVTKVFSVQILPLIRFISPSMFALLIVPFPTSNYPNPMVTPCIRHFNLHQIINLRPMYIQISKSFNPSPPPALQASPLNSANAFFQMCCFLASLFTIVSHQFWANFKGPNIFFLVLYLPNFFPNLGQLYCIYLT